MPARPLAAAAVAAALNLAACGGGDDAEVAEAITTTTTTTTTSTTTTTTTAPPPTAPPIAPLTGQLLGDDVLRSRPAMVVKVDNTPAAIGRQEGIDVADLVFVERVEGGATRLAAVFHSTNATVGPVRSARTTDLAIVANLGRPFFAFSGANGGVLRMVHEANVMPMSSEEVRDVYTERGRGLLRLFVDTAVLHSRVPFGAGPPPPQLTYRAAGAPVANAGAEPAREVTIRYPGRPGTVVRYIDEGMGWARVQGGRAHTVLSGARVAPDNVIVQFVGYRSSGFVDVTGSISPEAVMVGEGEAWVLTGGSVVRGRWSRPDLGAPTTYTDAAGAPIGLAPGTTWIELADAGTATVG